jgi:hypothetical protein
MPSRRITRNVKQHVDARLLGGHAQRALAQAGFHHHRRAEGGAQFRKPLIAGGKADLRQVGTVDRRRMQVDPHIRAAHHLVHEDMRQLRRHGARRQARKHAVEVAPVGQVAGMVEKAEGIDDGHRQQRARHRAQRRGPQQAAHDLDANHLVAVDRRRHEHYRPRAPPVDDLDREMHRRVIGQLAHRDIDAGTGARRNLFATDLEMFALRHVLPFVFDRRLRQSWRVCPCRGPLDRAPPYR